MDESSGRPSAGGVPRRRRERRLRAAERRPTGTEDRHQGQRGAPSPTGTDATSPGMRPAPLLEVRPQAHGGFELVLDPVVPQMRNSLCSLWKSLHPRPQCSKLLRQWWSTMHPGQQLFKHQRLWEYVAPAPSVVQAPSPVVEIFVPAPPAPAVSQSQAPVVEHFSPAPAVFRVGGLQGSVQGQSSTGRRGDEEAEVPRVTLLLRKGTDSKRHGMPPSQPLRYVFQAYCRRLGLHSGVGLVDGDEAEEQCVR